MNKGSKAIYVKGVKSGVCIFYTTLYIEYRFNGTHIEGVKSVLCIQSPPPPNSRRKGSFVKFLGLIKLQG